MSLNEQSAASIPLPTAAHRYLIVTADDFGLHESVNQAIEEASHAGVLTAASLMISGPAATDAVARAKRLPLLRVGLHVVLADGWSTLSHNEIPSLTDGDGFMNGDMLRRGIAIFASRSTRRQVAAEMRAQFEAYRRSGLPFDHVNVHKHFHLHPTVLGVLLPLAREYGVPAIRVPHEPFWFSRNHGTWRSCLSAALLAPFIELMKYRIRAAGIFRNDCVFGIARSGAMDEAMFLSVLSGLPSGVTEIYLHPASHAKGGIASSMAGYRHADELAALLSVRVRSAMVALNVTRGGYGDVLRSARRTVA
jgi:hopanoid biosynthesis associated protein HpnK